ncbi:FAD-dependent oxidoreductase [Jannaschia sp. W003]|uniref:FAD-dependent oxidoreductase n=1 Tax=Jannaschia sp. W003 TaxID=2867012 RepID=UPI0021A265F5|nr:FAD-dependent oxidoreductase [Jannaschia sp. W003]UWQ21579.1 FAD-dependent oxidoreductase [Jannaschia sp. W003]
MTRTPYDLIVVGGGVQGLCTGLLAAERGLRVRLVERGGLGGGATGGWFGILHGGLRYLQSLDVLRFRASLKDSRWFLRTLPDEVERHSFLLPLHDRGLRRPAVFRAAFAVERALGADRNLGVPPGGRLTRGRILSAAEVLRAAPLVPREGLTGGALWDELVVPDADAFVAALAARARAAGLEIDTGTEAEALVLDGPRVAGLRAGGAVLPAAAVVIAAGAWTPALARRFDPEARSPFGHPVRAFNLLLDRPPPSRHGLSVDDGGGAGMVFLRPMGRATFAGTAYLPHAGGADDLQIPDAAIAAFLARIDRALPGFGAAGARILAVTRGLLPGPEPGGTALLARDAIFNHGAAGGPQGLHSVWGVKLTTAPGLARRVLRTLR